MSIIPDNPGCWSDRSELLSNLSPCSGDELAVNYLATLRYIFRFIAALLYRNSICKFRRYAFVSLYFWTRVPWCSPFSNNQQHKKFHLRGECKKCICGESVKTAFGADSNRRWRRGALKETSSELHLLCNKPTIFTQLLFKIVQNISKIFSKYLPKRYLVPNCSFCACNQPSSRNFFSKFSQNVQTFVPYQPFASIWGEPVWAEH